MGDREIAPPSRVARVRLRQAFGDRHRLAERRQGLRQLALGHQDIADPVVGDREIAPPSRVARSRFQRPGGNGGGLVVGGAGGGEGAAGDGDVAQAELGPVEGEVVLAGLADGGDAAVGGFGLGQVAGVHLGVAVAEQPLHVVRVQAGGLGVGVSRLFRIGDGGDGGELAVGRGGAFVVGNRGGLGVFGGGFQQGGGLGGFALFQQGQGLGVAVVGGGAGGDGFDGFGQALGLAGGLGAGGVGGQEFQREGFGVEEFALDFDAGGVFAEEHPGGGAAAQSQGGDDGGGDFAVAGLAALGLDAAAFAFGTAEHVVRGHADQGGDDFR